MKKIFLTLLLLFAIVACGDREISQDKIIVKNGKMFVKGEKKPYTGVIVINQMGMKLKAYIDDGLMDPAKTNKLNGK